MWRSRDRGHAATFDDGAEPEQPKISLVDVARDIERTFTGTWG